MNSLWWLGLCLLALPILWHRQRRQRVREQPMATARFLPRSDPQQLRVWRWADRLLLLLRCLLLAGVVAYLADLVVPWRGDSVLVVPGTDSAWVEKQVKQAGFADAWAITLPPGDAFNWLARHQREWRGDARLLLLGDVAMPAALPRSNHQIDVRSRAPASPVALAQVRVAVVSKRAPQWKALFAAADASGPGRFIVAEQADARAQLIVWDVPEAPPPGLRAPLWWIGDATAFPELGKAATVDGLRYADSPRGRLWASSAWPPADADAARALFETWRRLHYAPQPYTMPAQRIEAGKAPAAAQTGGALHYTLTIMLLALFALERMLTHARRR